MREIKFQAWHKLLARMFAVYCIDWKHGLIFCQGEDGNTHTFGFIDMDLREYTGLKDKNGKEIYEGDIAKQIDEDEVGIVEWENEPPGFLLICKNEKWLLSTKRIEVISNIHESPELLQQPTG